MQPVLNRKSDISRLRFGFFPPEGGDRIGQLEIGRVRLDYGRRGFFRVAWDPRIILEDLSLEAPSSTAWQTNGQEIARTLEQVAPGAQGRVLIRRIHLVIPDGEFTARTALWGGADHLRLHGLQSASSTPTPPPFSDCLFWLSGPLAGTLAPPPRRPLPHRFLDAMNLARLFLALTLCAVLPALALAQTAATKIADGRAALVAQDLVTAQARFAEARALEPANETAAALLGITRFFALSESPTTHAYLDRLGVSATGRDLFDRTVSPTLTEDVNGALVLPAAYNLVELAAFWKNEVAPVSAAARADFATVISPGFILTLAADETGGVDGIGDITLDRGDILLLQSSLGFLEFFIHYLHGQNLDLDLHALNALAENDLDSLQRVLADNPSFLAIGNTTNRASARAALEQAVDLYLEASVAIRARAPDLERLFMLSPEDEADEEQFRADLDKLVASLDAPTSFSDEFESPPDVFFTGPLFGTTHSWRDQFPTFTTTGFNPLTIDPTLDGVAPSGLQRFEIAEALSSDLTAIEYPPLTNDDFADAMPLSGASGTVATHNVDATREEGEPIHLFETNFPASVWFVWTAPQNGVIAFETDAAFDSVLAVYTGSNLAALTLFNGNDQGGQDDNSRAVFAVTAGTTYRLAIEAFLDTDFTNLPAQGTLDLTWAYVTPPANDELAQATALSGLSGSTTGTTFNATANPSAPETPDTATGLSVWYSWTAPSSGTIAFRAYETQLGAYRFIVYPRPSVEIYTAAPALDEVGNGFYFGTATATVTAGQSYLVKVGGNEFGERMAFTLDWDYVTPPTIASITPMEGFPDTALTVTGTELNRIVAVFLGEVSAGYYYDVETEHLVFWIPSDAVSAPLYVVTEEGIVVASSSDITVLEPERPANDQFAQAAVLSGSSGSTNGTNLHATGEPGEPTHWNSSGTATSVWYTWTAPITGTITFDTNGSALDTVLAAYTGTSLLNLVQLAENDESASGATSLVSFAVTEGQTYYIAVGTYTTDGTGEFTLNWTDALPLNPYEEWQTVHFTSEEIADPGVSGPTVALAGDNAPNLLRFALGYGPRENLPAGALGTLARSGEEWVFSYSRPSSADNLTYSVQTTETLANPASWTETGITHEWVSTDLGIETWEGRFPVGAPRRFFRLRVTLTE